MSLTDKNNRLILDASVCAKQPTVFQPVNAESATGTVVILFFVNNDAEIVGLKLNSIELFIQPLYLAPVFYAVWFFSQAAYLRLDFPGLTFRIGDSVQLVEPSQYLAVGKSDNFIVATRIRNRKRQPPLGSTKAAAVQLENIFLAC